MSVTDAEFEVVHGAVDDQLLLANAPPTDRALPNPQPNFAYGLQPGHGYEFGLASKEVMAAHFRKFADDIESGAVLPQKVSTSCRATLDDFQMHTLLFKFAFKHNLAK